ncbi:MAG: tRNA-intron lyase [Nanohaloarchaea archaeon QH_8_44_6]|nr:MAG: tRNA-intron lyase [Nanohaloarchaea archaeon QH_8_44_6]
MIEASLVDSQVKIWDEDDADQIHDEKYYGKKMEQGELLLSMSEALHLVDRDEIVVKEDDREMSREEAFEKFCSLDEEFAQKFQVYSDLRERGYIVKSGFKFGAHFRVYPRGVNPYVDGPKDNKQHTQWVVHAVSENKTMSFQEMSRAVRLANNIRATMLWGVVDSENGVTYYEVDHVNP